MPAATASGSDGNANGSAKGRDHNQGNQGRKFSPEQKAAVIRVRKCAHTAFYEILGVEKTVSESEIKKAYRKLSLLTHPDKNGYEGADEAFKMVSRAFQILSDADKKEKFDRFGGDPDNRFSSSGPSPSPFSGFARSPRAGSSPMFEDEISPEELFNRFFGGGMGGGFGPFGNDMFGNGGSQFVFNLGGGPGFRVHQFGGGRPRRRPREANDAEQRPQSLTAILTNLLPLLILFVLPVISSLFSSTESGPSRPDVRFDLDPPYTALRRTPRWSIDYYVNPADVLDYTQNNLYQLDKKVEMDYMRGLQYQCQNERQNQARLVQEAQGWFFQDVDKMNQARSLEMRSCQRLRDLGVQLESYQY
ncbi:MAG: hypothetical protein MMC23_005404 [Stictis urceolatum]|nr:hypothetical protein [Stictis urceolata]